MEQAPVRESAVNAGQVEVRMDAMNLWRRVAPSWQCSLSVILSLQMKERLAPAW
jgi:hypothetical protein